MKISSDSPIFQSLDPINARHNERFWNTHLSDGNKIEDLQLHILGDIYKELATYPPLNYIPRAWLNDLVRFGFKLKFNPKIIPMTQEEEQEIEKSILDLDQGKSTFIITNHENFANIPIIIYKYIQTAHKIGYTHIINQIYTILGILLMTHRKQTMVINAISHNIITQPIGDMPKKDEKDPVSMELYDKYKSQISGAKEKIFEVLAPKRIGEKGNIVLCSPSGTRDVVYRNEKGEPTIFIPDEKQLSQKTTFNSLIKPIQENETNLMVIGTNSTAMKKGIHPHNNDRNRGAEVELHVKNISDSQLQVTRELLDVLVSQVQFHGQGIGKLIPFEAFSQLKKISKVRPLTKEDLKKAGVKIE